VEALLIDRWLRGLEAVPVLDVASVAVVREGVRSAAAGAGVPVRVAERAANVASELAHNQLAHALGGVVGVRVAARGEARGIEVVAADRGGGIAEPKEALRGKMRETGSLGVGLSGARELATEMDIEVRRGEGTCVRARVFDESVARGREVGVYSLAIAGEPVSGDDAVFVRDDEDGSGLQLAVADGLGHGTAARDAARVVVAPALEPGVDLERAFEQAHAAAGGTRGAVVAFARIDDTKAEVACLLAGNVAVQVVSPRAARRLGGTAGFAGMPGARPRARVQRESIAPRDALMLFTDGVTSRAAIEDDLELLREHPVVIAHEVLNRFGRPTDDALVLVVR
jgi:anti-sigma regulatory factor (Ser/Thr protein kinase)